MHVIQHIVIGVVRFLCFSFFFLFLAQHDYHRMGVSLIPFSFFISSLIPCPCFFIPSIFFIPQNALNFCLISPFFPRKGDFISDFFNPVISYSSAPTINQNSNNNNNTNNNTNNNNSNKSEPQETQTQSPDKNHSHKENEERDQEEQDELQKEEEALKELDNIVNAFRWYYFYVQQRLDRKKTSFLSLPPRHRLLVPDFESSILIINYCIPFFFFYIYI